MPLLESYLLAPELARHQAALDADDDTRAAHLEALGWTKVREGVWVIEGEDHGEADNDCDDSGCAYGSLPVPLGIHGDVQADDDAVHP